MVFDLRGFVPTDMAVEGGEFTIEILGDRRPARIITTPLVDPDGARMRGAYLIVAGND